MHAVRPDVADIALADLVFAPHYAKAMPRTVIAASAMLRTKPSEDSPAGSQLLMGEMFHVLDATAGWAWGYCGRDHYVGYVRLEALGAAEASTHIVSVREAILFEKPDIKSRALSTLSLGARLDGVIEKDFLTSSNGFVHCRHVAPVETQFDDPVTTAEQLLGTPYLWGGRGAGGVDCSGLVQLALSLRGIACPRDSDQQRESLGISVPIDTKLQRGDLIFFPGHVGFMVDEESLLHANAWWMAVTVEPLRTVIDRLRPSHEQPLLAVKRIDP